MGSSVTDCSVSWALTLKNKILGKTAETKSIRAYENWRYIIEYADILFEWEMGNFRINSLVTTLTNLDSKDSEVPRWQLSW